jgi:formylglycine-generating enzyme required for sulfatase activity
MKLPRRLAASAAVALMLVSTALPTSHAVTIDWVEVGNPGNANDTTGYGAVNYDFRIGKYEVTIQQYTDFLNAVDPSGADPHGLYNYSMGHNGNTRGISYSWGAASGHKYSPIGSGDRPITYVSWLDAARFANWMQNGQGSGSTETGAYTLAGAPHGEAVARNAEATFYIPTEHEWYKAAYYSPELNSGSGGYYAYATQSNSAPGNIVGGGANQANYFTGAGYSVTQSSYDRNQNYLTSVGAFTNAASYYGTFDQSGNVSEWNDLTGMVGESLARGNRGGDWRSSAYMLSSSAGGGNDPSDEYETFGFRLASSILAGGPGPVPEIDPAGMGSILALLGGGLGLLERRRKRA